jgi:hypothetical protein
MVYDTISKVLEGRDRRVIVYNSVNVIRKKIT